MHGKGADRYVGSWQCTCKVHEPIQPKKASKHGKKSQGLTYCTRTKSVKLGGVASLQEWTNRASWYTTKDLHQEDAKAEHAQDEDTVPIVDGEGSSSTSSSSSSSDTS